MQKKKNYNRSKSEILRLLWDYSNFHNGCVFVEYGLFNLIYIRFGVILTQFHINFSRQKHQIDVLFVPSAEILRFQSIPPFIFPLQSL